LLLPDFQSYSNLSPQSLPGIEKNFVYEENLQVPLLVRGPGIPEGITRAQTALTVDLAPTILDYAGVLPAVEATGRIDGISLRGVLARDAPLADTTLIQGGTSAPPALKAFGWRFRGVRTQRYTWARWWTGEIEFYDRAQDPFQLRNLYNNATHRLRDPAYGPVFSELASRYGALSSCAGVAECRGLRPAFEPTGGHGRATLGAGHLDDR